MDTIKAHIATCEILKKRFPNLTTKDVVVLAGDIVNAIVEISNASKQRSESPG